MQPSVPVTATATFCATIVDEWATLGVTSAFVAPGSRSTPLALALAARDDFLISVFHDERSAAFAALGNALATGQPAVLLCTSGTAAAHFFAAVIEADISCVPLLVCTADRPPELWNIGAPQTINQTHLYGDCVRAFFEPGPPEDNDPSSWRPLALRSYEQANGARPGPVHLNLSFRDPLVGQPDDLPPRMCVDPTVTNKTDVDKTDVSKATDQDCALLASYCLDSGGRPRRGVIIAGRGQSAPSVIMEFASRLGWPVLSDYRSGARSSDVGIRHFDALLRHAKFVTTHEPDVIVRLGEITSSKSTSQWIATTRAQVVAATPWGRRIDPERVDPVFLCEHGLLEGALQILQNTLETTPEGSPTIATPESEPVASWLDRWKAADNAANAAIRTQIGSHQGLAEPDVARATLASVPQGGALVVSSSMPVRDIEWFGEHRNDISVYSNRGANGIDGVTSTAIGIALSGVPTVCLIGDVAFLHDAGALTALARRSVDLSIVVTDNDGGGIFSFLPQNALLQIDRYEQLFGTPHGTNISALATAHGLKVVPWETPTIPIVAKGSGVTVLIATSDRASNQDLHDQIVDAVGNTLH